MMTRNLILLICIGMIFGCFSHNTSSNPSGGMFPISADVYNNYLYAYMSGDSAIQYANINSDGSINKWHIAIFPGVDSINNYFCSSTCLLGNDATVGVNYINNNYLYLFPYITYPPQHWSSDILIYMPLHNDGSIGSWFTATPFEGEYITASDGSLHIESLKIGFTYIIYNNYIYMIGGWYASYDGRYGYGDVTTTAYASINPVGSINQWQFTTGLYSDMPPIVFVYNNWLYAIASFTNTTYYRVPINPDGSFGERITYSTSIALT
ncbi:MAG: hypothetical protein M1381_06425, partial [Deltaproteobacteria bacterium]|nr:hypothetical protein [Deltaproteobacteria bacterium]